jgi:hypothetical protein
MKIGEVWCDDGRQNWLRIVSGCGRWYLGSFIGESMVCELLLLG